MIAKNVGVAVENQPPGLDAGAPPVGEQRLQHLGDAAAVRGGVDVPDHPPGESRAGAASGGQQAVRLLISQKLGQAIERSRLNVHLLHAAIIAAALPCAESRTVSTLGPPS